MLAHPDRRVQLARDDARQQPVSLLVAAVGEKAGCHLAVGDPVSGDGCAVGQQFLGHHVAVQVSEAVPAVLGGDGEADEPGVGEPDGEVGIPLGQPAVHRGHPAVCGAISGQEVPDRRTQIGQFAVIGAQGLEFAHRGGSLVRRCSRNCHVQPGGGRPYSVSVTDPARRDRLRELLDAVVDADNSERRRHGAQQLRVGVPLHAGGAKADRGVARGIAPPHHARACGLAVAWRRTGGCGGRRRRVVIGGGVLAGVPPHVRRCRRRRRSTSSSGCPRPTACISIRRSLCGWTATAIRRSPTFHS